MATCFFVSMMAYPFTRSDFQWEEFLFWTLWFKLSTHRFGFIFCPPSFSFFRVFACLRACVHAFLFLFAGVYFPFRVASLPFVLTMTWKPQPPSKQASLFCIPIEKGNCEVERTPPPRNVFWKHFFKKMFYYYSNQALGVFFFNSRGLSTWKLRSFWFSSFSVDGMGHFQKSS